MHDLVIRNALVCDGSGSPLFDGSVAVDGDQITAIGDASLSGRVQVVANGLVLAPGFIDIHTHYDAQITWDNTLTPSPQMGVTTIVMGNCGFGIAPCRPEHRDLTLRNLTKVEGMPLDALLTGVRWNFESFAEYLGAIENEGIVPNVAAFVGHGCIRTYVMGEDAARREATSAEIAEMQALFAQSLDDGAIGLGTSTLESHNGAGGVPMPSRFAAPEEFMAFSTVMRKAAKGVWQITKGATPDIEFLERLAAEAGRPMQICPMLQDPGQPEVVFDDMARISDASSRGSELWGQVSPFPEILEFSLREPYPMESITAWAPAMQAGDDDALRTVYSSDVFRAAVKAELSTRGGPFRFSNQWGTMTVTQTESDTLRGRTVADIAAERGVHPLDCMLDIGIESNFEARLRCVLFNADEPEVAKLLNHKHSTLGLGDAGAHLTFFCQAGTGLYLLQRYVRERGAVKLETAIALLTSQPADALRIPDRGRIAVGKKADLCLFDPNLAGIGERCWVADLPAGLSRVHTPPRGIHGVWVNGQRVVDDSGLLASAPRAGSVLREFSS
jgi:N-acyl-D-amino-acid deacylase